MLTTTPGKAVRDNFCSSGLKSFLGRRFFTDFFLLQKTLTASKSRRRPLTVALLKNPCIPQACTPKAPLRLIPRIWRPQATSAQRHQTCMYLLKYTIGSVLNHPRNQRMDCAYRFWTVTLSFCKGYATLQYASWAQDYLPVRSILPVAHILETQIKFPNSNPAMAAQGPAEPFAGARRQWREGHSC